MRDALDALIETLIAEQSIGSQDALLSALRRAGHALTQPSLSRRLKKLSIGKRAGRYQRIESLDAAQVSTAQAVPPNLLVLRTKPGFASALAFELDQRPLAGQAGTLAGDDTVFVALSGAGLKRALGELRRRGWLA